MKTSQRLAQVALSVLTCALLTLLLALPASAATTIDLTVDPAPPHCVLNDGASTATYQYQIDFTGSADYWTEVVVDPGSLLVNAFFYDATGLNFLLTPPGYVYVDMSGSPVTSPILGSGSFTPSFGAPLGAYVVTVGFIEIASLPVIQLATIYVCNSHGTIQAFKFEDYDADGVQDVGEPGIQNWGITISSLLGTVNLLTDSIGLAVDNQLMAGAYTVTEETRPGWKASTLSVVPVALVGGSTSTVQFGNYRPVAIQGGSFNDLNCNGVLDPGEPALAGATFTLTNTLLLPVLDADGLPVAPQIGSTFNFTNLVPGHYIVTEVNPIGFASSGAVAGSSGLVLNDDQIQINADGPTQVYAGSEFLDCLPNPCIQVSKSYIPPTAIIGQTVQNYYTVVNCGNVPLTVAITDTDLGSVLTQFIAANGGSAVLTSGSTVSFSVNSTVLPLTPDPLISTVTAVGVHAFGLPVTSIDTAVLDIVLPLPVSISGGAYNDLNNDGVLDPGDLPLGGATFTLTTLLGLPVLDISANPVAPQTGSTYNFTNLLPGSYLVTETNPSGYASTNAIPGTGSLKITNDVIRVNALLAGSAYPDNNFLDGQPTPCISITRSFNPTQALVGQSVALRFTVTNCGNTPLTSVTVIDTLLGNITPQFIAANGGAGMAAGASTSFTVNYIVPSMPPPGPYTVTATGTHAFGAPVTDSATGQFTVSNQVSSTLPVTLTQQQWDNHYADVLAGKAASAFARYSYYGKLYRGKVIAGKGKTITFDTTTAGTARMKAFFPQTGLANKLSRSYTNPTSTTSGRLGGETVALLLNVAFNDRRLMPQSRGYDLEDFYITSGWYRGKRVGEALNAGFRATGGDPPCALGLPSYSALADILAAINANYEYVAPGQFIDRGYLRPDRALVPEPPHDPVMPYVP